MKKIIFLLILQPFLAKSQDDTTLFIKSPNYGEIFRRVKPYSLMLPTDTFSNKIGVAQMGSKFFIYHTNKWNEFVGDSTSTNVFNIRTFGDQTATGTKTFSTIVVNKPATALPNNYLVDEDAALQIIGTTASGSGRMAITRIGTNPSYSGNRYNGTAASPTAVLNGNQLINIIGKGYNGDNAVNGAFIAFTASQNWTVGNNGTYMNFYTNPNNSSTLTSSFQIYPENIALPQTGFWNKLLYVSNDGGKLKVSDNSIRSVVDYGANGSDLLDDYPAFLAAINAGVKKIIVPEGTYYLSQALNLSDGISIEGISAERCILKSTASSSDDALVFANGSRTLLPNLSTNLAENATTVSLVSTVSLKRGDIIMFVDVKEGSFNASRTSYTNGFFGVVKDSVSALTSFALNGYGLAALPSATTQLWKITPTNTSVSNLTIDTKESHYDNGIRITYGNLNIINNVKIYGAKVEQIIFEYCFNSSLKNSMVGKHAPDIDQLSYGISVISSQDVLIDNVVASSTRHAVIIAAAGKFPPSRNVIVSNSTINAIGDQYAADMHGGTTNCTFKNNYINGGLTLGGANHTIISNTITNLLNFECIYITEAKQISHTIANNTIITNKINLTSRAWIGFNINDYTNEYGKLLISNNNFFYTFISGNIPTEGIRFRRISGSTVMEVDLIGNTFKMTGVTIPVFRSNAKLVNLSLLANNFDNLNNVIDSATKLTFLGNKGTTAPTTSNISMLVDEFNEWNGKNIYSTSALIPRRVPFTDDFGKLETTNNLTWDNTNARLGIGSTLPSFKLQVEDNTNASGGLFFRNNSIGSSAITQLITSAVTGDNLYGTASLRAYNSNNLAWKRVGGFFTDGNLTGGMVIYNTSSANTQFWTNNSRRMDITGDGNVLVGTSNNSGFRLDINGTARIVGKITQPTTSNSPLGSATLVNGTVTINNTLATTGCYIRINYRTGSPLYCTSSILVVTSVANASSFTVTAYNVGSTSINTIDNSLIEYQIFN